MEALIGIAYEKFDISTYRGTTVGFTWDEHELADGKIQAMWKRHASLTLHTENPADDLSVCMVLAWRAGAQVRYEESVDNFMFDGFKGDSYFARAVGATYG